MFDLEFEEINRRIVDHTSDINLTYSSIAREYLLREGLPADQIIKIGSPMYEVLNYYLSDIRASQIIEKLDLQKNKYFVVSAHREENVDSDRQFSNLANSLNRLAEVHKLPILISTHPRTRRRIEALKLKFHNLITLLKPLGFFDYVALQYAKVVLSDSGTINEESSILNFQR